MTNHYEIINEITGEIIVVQDKETYELLKQQCLEKTIDRCKLYCYVTLEDICEDPINHIAYCTIRRGL